MNSKQLRLMSSANFIAFTMLIPGLCSEAFKKKITIKSIIHDEQGQFKTAFEKYYKDSMYAGKIDIPKYFCDGELNFLPLKECFFSMRSSQSSDGLQLVDICLFLMKKAYEGTNITGTAKKLFDYTLKKGRQYNFTYDNLERTVFIDNSIMMNMPFTPEDESRGRKMCQQIEENRKRNMAEFEIKQNLKSNCVK